MSDLPSLTFRAEGYLQFYCMWQPMSWDLFSQWYIASMTGGLFLQLSPSDRVPATPPWPFDHSAVWD
jgi:hypothetical protein